MSSLEYTQLVALIQDATGLTVDENRMRDIQRVTAAMLEVEGLPDVGALTKQLATLPPTHVLWRDLVNTVTVSETYFYRNRAHMNALRDHLLPDLIRQKTAAGSRSIRIWSAGCASGEEPYSLAMLFDEVLPQQMGWHISILGTDIDRASLERAQHGVYRPSSFRNETPDYVQDRWFTATDEGFVLSPAIRDRVTFAPLNLIDDHYPSANSGTTQLDLLICRNVTIYFSEATTRAVVGRFSKGLVDDGWLIVGHSEPLASTYQEKGFVPRNFENAVFYQKNIEEAARLPTIQDLLSPRAIVPPPVPKPKTKPVKPKPEARKAPAGASSRSPEMERRLAELRLSRQGDKRPSRPVSPKPRTAPTPPPAATHDEDPCAPLAIDSPLGQAKLAADRGNWDEALALADAVVKAEPMDENAHYLRGLVFMQVGDLNAALHALRQSVYCEPRFALAQYMLGELYEKRQNNRQAARHWRLALQIIDELEPESCLWFSDDLTAEMLRGLLNHRLAQLPDDAGEV